jgi:hypothetical protein
MLRREERQCLPQHPEAHLGGSTGAGHQACAFPRLPLPNYRSPRALCNRVRVLPRSPSHAYCHRLHRVIVCH